MLAAVKGGIEKENLGSLYPVELFKLELEGKRDRSGGLEHQGQKTSLAQSRVILFRPIGKGMSFVLKLKSSIHP